MASSRQRQGECLTCFIKRKIGRSLTTKEVLMARTAEKCSSGIKIFTVPPKPNIWQLEGARDDRQCFYDFERHMKDSCERCSITYQQEIRDFIE
jgi:hypothetical protein